MTDGMQNGIGDYDEVGPAHELITIIKLDTANATALFKTLDLNADIEFDVALEDIDLQHLGKLGLDPEDIADIKALDDEDGDMTGNLTDSNVTKAEEAETEKLEDASEKKSSQTGNEEKAAEKPGGPAT